MVSPRALNQFVRDGRVFCPGGNQPPQEKVGCTAAIVGNGKDGLRWRNVVARRELGWENEIAECVLQFGGRVNGEGRIVRT